MLVIAVNGFRFGIEVWITIYNRYFLRADKAVVRIAAIEIAIDHLLDMGPPESVLPGEILVIDPDKGFKIVLYAAVIHALSMVYFQRPLCLLAFSPILLTS